MADGESAGRRVHGDGGAYVAGDWVPIEECADRYNVAGGSCKGHCAGCPRSRTRERAERTDGAYDVAVVGAGCIGAAIARELSRTTASVLLLEAADDVTQGATKGNSGIVHAGYDDKPGTVKARYCWPGNQMFSQLDRELHFGYQQNGSLVVAKGPEDEAILQELLLRGEKNKVKNLRVIGQAELRAKEPYIHPDATAALYSPDAGTVTPYEYTIALAENAADNGVEVRIRREVVNIESPAGGPARFKLTVKHWEPSQLAGRLIGRLSLLNLAGICGAVSAAGSGAVLVWAPELAGVGLWVLLAVANCLAFLFGWLARTAGLERWEYSPSKGTVLGGLARTETVWADYVVNAAGCRSDLVAAMVGQEFVVKPRLGEYILLHKDEGYKCSHTLFPTPHPVYGKGVLVQNTLWGNLILGPTARDTMLKDEQSGKYVVNQKVADEDNNNIMGYILSKCRSLVPSFDAAKVIHTFAGVRAKNSTGDWIIGPAPGQPCFINAASIDSPGIAASPAIAIDVVRMLKEAGAPVNQLDPNFNPVRAPIVVPKVGLRGLKMNKTAWWKEKDPAKNVVCKCERVTEAEVVDAIHRSLPIDSTQAIRKRTRAGMGHCQGDPANYCCEERVATIIARETGLGLHEVGRRPWPASSMLSKRLIGDTDRQLLRELSQPGRQYSLHGAAD